MTHTISMRGYHLTGLSDAETCVALRWFQANDGVLFLRVFVPKGADCYNISMQLATGGGTYTCNRDGEALGKALHRILKDAHT